LPREGTSGCENVARVTAGEVEAILAAFTARERSEKSLTTREVKEATGVSELVAHRGHSTLGGMSRNRDEYSPARPAIREAIRAS